jgi:sec-independent protein translocase protein TatA
MFLKEPSHILILVLVVTVVFGARRLPDSARALGRSLRIFKSEVNDFNGSLKIEEPNVKPAVTPTE